jgi:hypothetical protein
MTKSRRMRLTGHVARTGEINAGKMLVGELKGKRPLGRPMLRRKENNRWISGK